MKKASVATATAATAATAVPPGFSVEKLDDAMLRGTRIVCAWCGRELQAGHGPPSHGICGPCATRFCDEAGL